MKRLLLLALILSLTGCAAPRTDPQPLPPAVEAMAALPSEPDAARLGIAAVANIAKSMHATWDFPGYAHTEVTVAAVLVDSRGVIRQCAIDGISAAIPFDATGALQLTDGTEFPSKCTLGQSYGMHKASPLGTEWAEQAADFAAACVGKTAAELQSGDTLTSVTIATDALHQAVCRAVENAAASALADDTLALSCRAVVTESRSGCIDDGTPGLACLRAAAAAFTLRGGTVTAETGCAVLSAVPFTAAGRIDCDISLGLSALSDTLTLTAITPEEMADLREFSQKN